MGYLMISLVWLLKYSTFVSSSPSQDNVSRKHDLGTPDTTKILGCHQPKFIKTLIGSIKVTGQNISDAFARGTLLSICSFCLAVMPINISLVARFCYHIMHDLTTIDQTKSGHAGSFERKKIHTSIPSEN